MPKTLYPLLLCTLLSLLPATAPAADADAADDGSYRVDWVIALEAGVDWAEVRLEVADGRPIRDLRFSYDPERLRNFEASGTLEVDEEQHSVHWQPPRTKASLSWQARVTRERANRNQDESYDALMTDDWALFRGDRLIPGMSVTTRKGVTADTRLRFELPDGWGATTGWPRDRSHRSSPQYFVDDPERRFDRPTGWMLAGHFGSRRDVMGSTEFFIAAPRNASADRGSWLTLVGLVWEELELAFGTVPPKILMVSADDPLWRGGLSGPNSFYFHGSRRAVSENGSSPLVHELVHVVTRLSGGERDDWITEGLAEFYGVELIYRAGGMSERRRSEIMARLADWAAGAGNLRGDSSSGQVTAKAVGVFDALDREIRERTDGEASIDSVTRLLMQKRRVNLDDLRAAAEQVSGSPSRVLAELR
jgi:hypothetical protein